MQLEHDTHRPRVHETAYVAPNAVVSGDVTIGEHCAVLYGAVLTSEGGPVVLGSHCVVMENAVLRGTPGHGCILGDDVLVGPGAHLTGCSVEDGAFLATGSAVFNGAVVGQGSEVRIHGVVHVNSVLLPGSMVPIGWIAVGNPANVFAPSEHERLWPIQRSMNFSRTVFNADRDAPAGEKIRRYARALGSHRSDRPLDE